jgi:hypothetical protein
MNIFSYDVSLLGAVLSSLVAFILGWAWYSPALFGNVMMNEVKMPKAKKPSNSKMFSSMLICFIGTIITSLMLSVLLASTSLSMFTLVFVVWLGFFAVATLLGDVLWKCTSWKLFAINAAYWLVYLALLAWVSSYFN